MEWSKEAKRSLGRVPFFIRKRVKARVEEEALRRGDHMVTLDHVDTCQKRFLNRMEEEVRGYQVETCFGPGGCPNRAVVADGLVKEIEHDLAGRDMKDFLESHVKGPLKMHHEFRISISDCPNACSRPQIVDIGLIGAARPGVTPVPCSECGTCVEVCRESAIFMVDSGPTISESHCLGCGACIRACPTGTIEEVSSGYRVLVGGRLGRHPKLGEEIPGIHNPTEVFEIIKYFLDLYQEHCRGGERLGVVLERVGIKKWTP